MSGYEEEHNIPRPITTPSSTRRRPDMTSFFSALSSTHPSSSPQNPHAVPMPSDMAALYRDLANSYRIMMGETEGIAPSSLDDHFSPSDPSAHAHTNELLGQLVQTLMQSAENPPSKLDGMPESFFDELERVSKSQIRKEDECPICGNPFLEDKYPLVVELPCGGKLKEGSRTRGHWFDMECVRPWLSVKSTCPLDRVDLRRRGEEKARMVKEAVSKKVDEEEEWDEMFA